MAAGNLQETVQCLKDYPAQVGNFGCNGAAPQTAAVLGAAVVTTATTQTTPFGFATQAQGDALVARVNAILVALKDNGIGVTA